jgi:hypothetical protein
VVRALAILLLLAPSLARAWPIYGDSGSGVGDKFNPSPFAMRESLPRLDGNFHVDTPRLIERLVALHATTYAFLIWRASSDWDDFTQEFLPAAEAAGIEVWAYLVPLSEKGAFDVPPCQLDFVCWAQQVGAVAQQHPNLTAILIDDFQFSTFGAFTRVPELTPQYMKQVSDALHAASPTMKIHVIGYDPGTAFYMTYDYQGSIDGIVLAYLDLQSTDAIPDQLDRACAIVRRPTDVWSISTFPPDGGAAPQAGDRISIDGTAYATGAAQVMRFELWDPGAGSPGTAARRLELSVGGTVVWQRDQSAGFGIGWEKIEVDLTAAIAGRPSVAISLSLIDNADGPGAYEEPRLVMGASQGLTFGDFSTSRVGNGSSSSGAATMDYQGRCVLMVFGWATTPPVPTVDYLTAALGIGQDAIVAGEADGLMTYFLDKNPGSMTFDPVAALYEQWRPDAAVSSKNTDGGAALPYGSDAGTIIGSGSSCAIAGRAEDRSFGLALLIVAALLARRRIRQSCAGWIWPRTSP